MIANLGEKGNYESLVIEKAMGNHSFSRNCIYSKIIKEKEPEVGSHTHTHNSIFLTLSASYKFRAAGAPWPWLVTSLGQS